MGADRAEDSRCNGVTTTAPHATAPVAAEASRRALRQEVRGDGGLIEEGKEVLEADGPGPIIDAALIAAAQRVEHYEISAYGTVRALAQHLGHTKVVKLLDATLTRRAT